jgi:hypothetical protein
VAHLGLIYDSEASYSHHERAPDRTHPAMAPPQDDVHPMWGVHLHFPDRGEVGGHTHVIPHAVLEWMCSWHGFDPEELPTVLDVVLHHAHVPDPDDVLAWQDPHLCWLMSRIHDELPDPLDYRMPYDERREVMLARVRAIKKHHLRITPAPWEDRAGALYARAAAVRRVSAELAAKGVEMPPQFQLGLEDQAADDPLHAILKTRIDPARVAARRARDEWIQSRQDRAVSRALTAMRSPMTFGVIRKLPPTVEEFLAAA